MAHLPRRQFFKQTLAAAATITLAGTKSTGRVLGANEAVRIGVAGLNGRGSAHVAEFSRIPGVQITYLIDPDPRTYAARLRQHKTAGGSAEPRTVQDVRRALEDKNLDAISVATPNHWHALMTIWGAQAGKHVYVEKPCSHNVKEGRIAVEAARRHNVIVQHGTQSRSSSGMANTIALIQSGRFGRLLVSRGLCYKPRGTIGQVGPQGGDIPAALDYDLWCGPAPMQKPLHRTRLHYDWHWFWDYGNGDIGNQGVHEMDKARWAIAGATLPRSVICLGGRFGYTDSAETPNTQIAVFDYGPTQLIFEVRGLRTDGYRGEKIGNIFHCEEGTIAGNRFYPRGSDEHQPLPRLDSARAARPGGGNHFANFIAAVRSGRREDLNADILEGHYSAALCHLANVSYRLGENAPFNPRTRAFGDNREAYETLERMEEHLGQGNSLKLADMTCRVGRKLDINASTESIVGNEDANRLLTRQYRAPFLVPERIG
jgi:predicted dehydrogenase